MLRNAHVVVAIVLLAALGGADQSEAGQPHKEKNYFQETEYNNPEAFHKAFEVHGQNLKVSRMSASSLLLMTPYVTQCRGDSLKAVALICCLNTPQAVIDSISQKQLIGVNEVITNVLQDVHREHYGYNYGKKEEFLQTSSEINAPSPSQEEAITKRKPVPFLKQLKEAADARAARGNKIDQSQMSEVNEVASAKVHLEQAKKQLADLLTFKSQIAADPFATPTSNDLSLLVGEDIDHKIVVVKQKVNRLTLELAAARAELKQVKEAAEAEEAATAAKEAEIALAAAKARLPPTSVRLKHLEVVAAEKRSIAEKEESEAKEAALEAEDVPSTHVNLWRRLFNCKRCGMNDGTIGLDKIHKKVAQYHQDSTSTNSTSSAGSADMFIQAIWAVEWTITPITNPIPNTMQCYICDPAPGNLLYSKKAFEATQSNEKLTDEAIDNRVEEVQDTGHGDKAAKGGEEVEQRGLFMKVMHGIIKGVSRFGDAVFKAFKLLGQMLFTSVRCAICVLCNLMNQLRSLLEFIQKKATAGLKFMSEKGVPYLEGLTPHYKNWFHRQGDKKEMEKKRRDHLITLREKVPGNLGDYCRDNKHCVSGHCIKIIMAKNACGGSPLQKEYRGQTKCGLLMSVGQCKGAGCRWRGHFAVTVKPNTCQQYVQGKGEVGHGPFKGPAMKIFERLDPPEESPEKLLQVSDHVLDAKEDPFLHHLALSDLGDIDTHFNALTPTQKINRAALNLHHNKAFHDTERFLDTHFYTPWTTQKVMSNTVAMLQKGASADTQEDNTKLSAEDVKRQHARKQVSVIKLPNKCVNDHALGNTVDVLVTFEVPSLVKALTTMPFSMAGVIPELYGTFMPRVVKGNNVDAACLMGNAMKETFQNLKTRAEKNRETAQENRYHALHEARGYTQRRHPRDKSVPISHDRVEDDMLARMEAQSVDPEANPAGKIGEGITAT